MLMPCVSDRPRTMAEGAVNGAARPGSGTPHVGPEWGREPEWGGPSSQQRGSETALIGRGWSCGGRKGEGITCGSAADGGGAPGRGPARGGMGAGFGGVAALGALGLGPGGAELRSCTPREKGLGGLVKGGLGLWPAAETAEQRFLGWAAQS